MFDSFLNTPLLDLPQISQIRGSPRYDYENTQPKNKTKG